MNLIATLGDFEDDGKGKLLKVDLESEKAQEILTYNPPDNFKVPGKGFTGACWLNKNDKKDLLICGFSAFYHFETKYWNLKGIYHSPCFNDLHHISVNDNYIYIANTGFDRIEVLDTNFKYIGGYNLEPIWMSFKRYSGTNPTKISWENAFKIQSNGKTIEIVDNGPPKDQYYSSNQNFTQFHQKKLTDFIHPNHISFLNDNILITRFNDCSIQNLKDWKIIIKDIPGHPHDGKVYENIFWITCTNGLIIGYEIENGIPGHNIIEKINIFDYTKHTGWLRGLLIKDDVIIVGLTKITRMPRYRWCELPFENTETSILAIDYESKKLLYHVNLNDFGLHPKIFDLIEI
jgi:hypothetical protein